jgi:hypothetical protein
MTRISISAALIAFAIPPGGSAMAQSLSPRQAFEANLAMQAKNGAAHPVHVTVQSWGLADQRGRSGPPHEIPLRGFYVAHLLSGDVSTIMDGQTTKRAPGDYWTVRAGSTMQVKVLGEYAVLETILVAKQ